MFKTKAFLTSEEENAIVEAIKAAELNTSGEIRVHIEKQLKNKTIDDRAQEVFHDLGMDATELKNGVLIFIAVKDQQFGIYGDQGINDLVGNDFWKSTKDIIQDYFKEGEFKQGIVEGILKAGEQLKKHFPYSIDDINELPNEISKG